MVGRTLTHIGDPAYEALTREREPPSFESGEALRNYDDPQPNQYDNLTNWYSTKVPLFDSRSAVTSVVTVSQDISERSHVETALRESEERYASAMKGTNEGFWDWEFKTARIVISPFLAVYFGLPEQTNSITNAE